MFTLFDTAKNTTKIFYHKDQEMGYLDNVAIIFGDGGA